MGFEHWQDYHRFSHYVKRNLRYVRDYKNDRFLESVLQSAAKRRIGLASGTKLWRAQLGHDWREQAILDDDGKVVDTYETEWPFDSGRMTPQVDRAFEGRVNPKGIPCLYLSTDQFTAMAEVRPWIDSYVSLAVFEVTRELVLIDCTKDEPSFGPSPFSPVDPTPAETEGYVWGDINAAYSEPVTRIDDVADYAPTQVIAETFKNAGFDGVCYGSKVGKGKSIALFDIANAKCGRCSLFKVEDIDFKFGPENW